MERVVGIILAGLAGALDLSVRAGDIIVDNLSASPATPGEGGGEGSERKASEGERFGWPKSLLPSPPREYRERGSEHIVRFGRIHTSSHLVSTPAAKAELFQSTGALAVDMEGVIVRELALSLGVPFMHVRGISDAADTALDPAMMGFIDDVGRVKPLALTATLLKRPGLIPRLMRLGLDSNLAACNVGKYLHRMLSETSTGCGTIP